MLPGVSWGVPASVVVNGDASFILGDEFCWGLEHSGAHRLRLLGLKV